ncbi:sensory rhodopsin transducer [Hephaestia sp. GCM10023244]|uniref:sensory rhodopsin transducer n=1 Tax=unclassified Hephaestia TaxID=2631281 RepID=UPI00336BEE22
MLRSCCFSPTANPSVHTKWLSARAARCICASTKSTIPNGTVGHRYASVITADAPIVVQHTRLDSRAAEIALLSTMAYPA